MMNLLRIAGYGKYFVLTPKGYERSLKTGDKELAKERCIGKPIRGFEEKVPAKWVLNGWVVEVNCEGRCVDASKQK